MKRRTFLQGSLAASAVSVGCLGVSDVHAATKHKHKPSTPPPEPEPPPVVTPTSVPELPTAPTPATASAAFDAPTLEEAYKSMALAPEASKDISIKAPELAENGSVIPVRITTSIEDARQILIVVPENPHPLAAAFFLGAKAEPMAYTRIRLQGDATIIAIVKTTREAFFAKHTVKVAVGCQL